MSEPWPEADRAAYFYCVLQVVPRVERDERFNAGVVLFCRAQRFLGVQVKLDRSKLTALAPDVDPEGVERHLAAMVAVAQGDPAGGPIAGLTLAERFHWLSSPASTIIQPGPIHTGLSDDPVVTLARLFKVLVD